MIEIKPQGAKPGHGGVLPKEKISKEIAEREASRMMLTVYLNTHSAFSKPKELLSFINILKIYQWKPVGFKLCIGHP